MANINDIIREMFPRLEPTHPLDRKGSTGRLVSGIVFIILVAAITIYVTLTPDRNAQEDPTLANEVAVDTLSSTPSALPSSTDGALELK